MLIVGDQDATVGLSKKIYDDMVDILEAQNVFTYTDEDGNTVNWSNDNINTFKERLKKTSYAQAKSIVEYIQSNASVDMTNYYTWLAGLMAVIQSSLTHAAMIAAITIYLATSPLPTFITYPGSIQ